MADTSPNLRLVPRGMLLHCTTFLVIFCQIFFYKIKTLNMKKCRKIHGIFQRFFPKIGSMSLSFSVPITLSEPSSLPLSLRQSILIQVVLPPSRAHSPLLSATLTSPFSPSAFSRIIFLVLIVIFILSHDIFTILRALPFK